MQALWDDERSRVRMSHSHVREHIALIAKHEQEFLARRTLSERAGDAIAAFAGSLIFVGIHVLIFVGWIGVNSMRIERLPPFDPPPFSLLGTLVALEAILLASFILMRQSRMSRRADERNHLMLQVLLLTEKELTAVLQMDRQIAARVGLTAANTVDVEALAKPTSIDEVVRAIEQEVPPTQ